MLRPRFVNKQLGGLRFLYVCMSARWYGSGDVKPIYFVELCPAEDMGEMIQQIQTTAALWAGAAK